MSLPDQAPRLPKWPFFLGDGLLLLTAWYIARSQGHGPISGNPLTAVVLCVVVAAILGVIPLIADYAWTQDKALDERQRSLEALARTIGTASEQISIAAGGLHEIVEAAAKNLRSADQLPQKVQERLAEMQERAATQESDQIDELEKEIATLRASENDKLEASVAKVAKAATEFSKAEAAIQKLLSQAATQSEASAKAQSVAALAIREAAQAAVKAIEEARPAPVSPLAVSEPIKQELSLPEAVEAVVTPPPEEPKAVLAADEPAPVVISPEAEVTPVVPSTPTPFEAEEPAATVAPKPEPEPEPEPEIALVSPAPEPAPAVEAPAPEPVGITEAASPASPPKTPRKRSPKKAETEPEPTNGDEFVQEAPAEPTAQQEMSDLAISSDGATRLLVTAYIGIGNRLFIRGSGPGLTWEKGVPLQFVSIGKWRWETADATAPVIFRLYKNDDVECTGLGERTIGPGHQQQLAASF